MSKRFTDTGIWKKQWYRKLPPRLKCFWAYLLDNCDSAGIWDSDFGLASYQIGEEVAESDLTAFGDRIEKLEDNKYLLNTFINFQYGQLSDKCKPHLPVLRILKKHGLNPTDFLDPDFKGKTHNVSPKTRAFVIERDKKTCAYCERLCSNFDLVLDHVIPRSTNGSDKSENLVVSCRRCNLKKSDFSLEDFIKRNNLPERVLERVSERVSVTLKEKEKDKDKDKEEDKEEGGLGGDFSKFWKTYPHRRDDSNYHAKTAFDMLVNWESVSPGEIINGAANYAAFIKSEQTKERFIPNAVKWLEKRQWKDFQTEIKAEKYSPEVKKAMENARARVKKSQKRTV